MVQGLTLEKPRGGIAVSVHVHDLGRGLSCFSVQAYQAACNVCKPVALGRIEDGHEQLTVLVADIGHPGCAAGINSRKLPGHL